MAGLVISLKPNEKFLVNGALLSNGPKRGQLCIDNDDVHVLRMSDVLHPSEIDTPVKRVYYSTQLILSGDVKASDNHQEVCEGLSALIDVFRDTPLSVLLTKAKNSAMAGRYYSVLCSLKNLLPIEDELLSRPVPTYREDAVLMALSA